MCTYRPMFVVTETTVKVCIHLITGECFFHVVGFVAFNYYTEEWKWVPQINRRDKANGWKKWAYTADSSSLSNTPHQWHHEELKPPGCFFARWKPESHGQNMNCSELAVGTHWHKHVTQNCTSSVHEGDICGTQHDRWTRRLEGMQQRERKLWGGALQGSRGLPRLTSHRHNMGQLSSAPESAPNYVEQSTPGTSMASRSAPIHIRLHREQDANQLIQADRPPIYRPTYRY